MSAGFTAPKKHIIKIESHSIFKGSSQVIAANVPVDSIADIITISLIFPVLSAILANIRLPGRLHPNVRLVAILAIYVGFE